MAERAMKNKVVHFKYRIRDAKTDGILEISDVPIGYVHGVNSDIFIEIEEALEGQFVNYKTSLELGYDQAFGPHNPTLTFVDDIQNSPPEYRRIGAEAMFENNTGKTVTMVVTKIEDGKIHLDGNHPLAGKDLIYDIELISIRPATQQEIQTKEVAS